jgi:hypothetical protein
MPEILSFDGHRQRRCVPSMPRASADQQPKPAQVVAPAVRKSPAVEGRYLAGRLVSRFERGFSVEQVAAWEHVSRLRVQRAVRDALLDSRRAA